MDLVISSLSDGIATLMINRGKVNALNAELVNHLRAELKKLEADTSVKAIILTGSGKFFSFGFDIPQFLSFKKEEFIAYLENFTDLYTYLFLYPKPVVAALNGHAMAGGCMLALASDYRVMVNGKAKISLNEIGFGSSVFAGSVEMLRFWVGGANASTILYSGSMYFAEEAQRLGLVNEIASELELDHISTQAASNLGSKHPPAFASIKALLRRSTAEEMKRREAASIKEFADIWYSEVTWSNLQNITIRES
ncbi:MAG TPA: enoyl-CoA hydratase/isomerase family protein [Blastocatellia bacterium]|nr:enoyl-CoA hydratase/isomerase family protein [Blastocatellia bacterium]